MATTYNKKMRETDPTLKVDFEKLYVRVLSYLWIFIWITTYDRHQPHITLYMTDFLDEYIPTVISTIEDVVHAISAGNISQTTAYQSCLFFLLLVFIYTFPPATYVMWNTSLNEFMSNLSDTIVNRTCAYVSNSFLPPLAETLLFVR